MDPIKFHITLKVALCFILLMVYCPVFAQKPLWVGQLAGIGETDAHSIEIAPNGSVYVAGSFTGSVDLDPSSAAYVISSKGAKDIFLACYSSNGQFKWGFGIGGKSDDIVENVTADKDNNPIIVGQFRGKDVDFDPNSGIKYLYSNGNCDGYVAKYSATGNYLWAFKLGGSTDHDDAQSVVTDEAGNVYVGGNFHGDMDIDPDVIGNYNINSLTGTAFLTKYTAGGTFSWGFNFGGGGLSGVDNTVWGMKYYNGDVYLVGCFQGANADFDPSPAFKLLTASGAYDGYLAKYSNDGAFQYVTELKGTANEQVLDISMNTVGDIFVTGYSESSSIDFGGSGTVSCPGGNGNSDVFIAAYTNAGQYRWAHAFGGNGTDIGWGIVVADSSIYCTGYYQQQVDLDPSVATDNVHSKGMNDVYVSKFNSKGDYICGFSIGDTLNDNGRKIKSDVSRNIYLAGLFSPSNVDFDPFNSTFMLNSVGGTDGFFVKYDWSNGYLPANGYLIGDTICAGNPIYLTFVANAGNGPFTIRYTDGVDTFTKEGINSGELFLSDANPTETTVFTLTYVRGEGLCAPPGYPDKPVIITVYPKPLADAGWDTSVCPGAKVRLNGKGGGAYRWYPIGLTYGDTPNPELYIKDSTVCWLVVTNSYGCTDTDAITLTVIPANFKADSLKHLCIGDTVQLRAEGGDIYTWSPVDSMTFETNSKVYVWPKASRIYKVLINDTVCQRSAILDVRVDVHALPDVSVLARDADCGLKKGRLKASGAVSYVWSPTNSLNDSLSSEPEAFPEVNTIYTVVGRDVYGCMDTVTAEIKVFEGNGRLFAPDAFTPNNDGVNDCYRIRVPGDVSSFECLIFNRFGQIVFQGDNVTACWDGSFQGVEQPLGTYFYYYKCNSSVCGDIIGKGDLHLIR